MYSFSVGDRNIVSGSSCRSCHLAEEIRATVNMACRKTSRPETNIHFIIEVQAKQLSTATEMS